MEIQGIIQGWIIYLLFLVGSAICVAGKFSFVQLRSEYINERIEEGEVHARKLLPFYQAPEYFLGAAQLGVIISLSLCGIAIFYVLKNSYGLFFNYILSKELVILLITIFGILITIVTWILGAFIPKSIALYNSFTVLLKIGTMIFIWQRICTPLLAIGIYISKRIVHLFHQTLTNEFDISHTEDELRMLVTASHKEGKIDTVESELIDNVFDFVDRMAKEIMVPRQDIVCLYTQDTMADYLDTIRSFRHTRYPLCEGDKDHVLGLVHIKDFMEVYIQKKRNLRTIKHPILIIPEIMSVSSLLQLMRSKRTYLAMVVDEYGSTVGLIGLEDILEELVGTIQNEHSIEKEEIQSFANGTYELAGTVLVKDVEELLHLSMLEEVDADTIGGYVFYMLGHTPALEDSVIIGTYKFTVKELRRFRIARLYVEPYKDTKDKE
ncbi:hemolysin family protein [Megasphaera sp. UPII 135-E]|uniref:hemolysin family protein n=1 Tax=Megasphaera sp. UPII 135-E TaxID=1000569 RepID=UPI00021A2911|nr:hemolysin family protein [Megasphaera sp. UPII 135-E]EGS33114.1 CBS domain protein [Megasphaera sp. UPII 135-E]